MPAPCVQERSPAAFMPTRLSQLSSSLVAEWCGGSGSSAPSLAAHIPLIIGSVGQYVQNPAFDVRREIVAQLRATGGDGSKLDSSGHDLLAWLDGLSRLIMRRMHQEVARYERACDARITMAQFERLSEGLRDMTSVIVGEYLDRDSDRQQESTRRHGHSRLVFAHEMRGPLHTISLSASLLEMPGPATNPDEQKRLLKIIRSALVQAEWLLQHADLLTRSEDPESLTLTTSIQRVLESITEGLSAQAMASGVELRLSNAAPALAVDSGMANLVLSNLIVNAIKYADQTKEKRWVSMRAEMTEGDDPRFVTVEVADNGIGIPASMQRRVFQRGYRAHPQSADGLGLGLAIVRDLLDDRGGSIDLISEEQIGTTVRCRLPASPVEVVIKQKTRATTGLHIA
jgi:signal transduction histidine kinase